MPILGRMVAAVTDISHRIKKATQLRESAARNETQGEEGVQ